MPLFLNLHRCATPSTGSTSGVLLIPDGPDSGSPKVSISVASSLSPLPEWTHEGVHAAGSPTHTAGQQFHLSGENGMRQRVSVDRRGASDSHQENATDVGNSHQGKL